jgi:hypothetical protein
MSTDSSPQTPSAPSRRTERIWLVIYCLGFGVGSLAHVVDWVTKGPLSYTEGLLPGTTVPLVWNAFMTSLAVFNPLTVVLLLVRRRAGIALGLAILALVVVMNLSLTVLWWRQSGLFFHHWLYVNGSFCVFFFVTAGRMWRSAPGAQPAPSAPPASAG